MKPDCLVEECRRPARTLGLCEGHYRQFWRHGRITNVNLLERKQGVIMTNVATNRAALAAYKAQGCQICGEEDVDVIELHHLHPEDKLFTTSGGALRRNILVFAAELSKQVPLCGNCHTKIHLGKVELEENEI